MKNEKGEKENNLGRKGVRWQNERKVKKNEKGNERRTK